MSNKKGLGDILGSITDFIEANPAIISLGTEGIKAAIDFVTAALKAHNAGVLTDEQLQASWNLITQGGLVSDQELTDAIAAYRAEQAKIAATAKPLS